MTTTDVVLPIPNFGRAVGETLTIDRRKKIPDVLKPF
jgi:hypothetical protein